MLSLYIFGGKTGGYNGGDILRLRVTFMLEDYVLIPIDHQHALLGLVYRLLSA